MANRRKEHLSRPRDERARDRRTVVVGSDGDAIGPSLFEVTGRPAGSWPPAVVRWFEAWRRSPQARLFVSDVEWQALGRAAWLVEQYLADDTAPSVRVQTWQAIMRFEGSLGATFSDRVRSQIKVRPAEVGEVPVAPAVDYRWLLRPVDPEPE
ncbi:MAG: hypothetical protein KDB51_14900 [Propionibacteriaceae bacterium]|nr:hypothetical protein [Propionibacteriaceae bacterium]